MERRRPGKRRELSPYQEHELLTGRIMYPVLGYDGYGDGQSTDLHDFISEEMRLDWVDNRTALIAFWKSGEYTDRLPWLFVRGYPDTLPWAAKIFDEDDGDPKQRRTMKEAHP